MVAASVNAPPKPIIFCSFSSVSTTTVPHSPFCGQRALAALSLLPLLLLLSSEELLSSSSLSAPEVHSCKHQHHNHSVRRSQRAALIAGSLLFSLENGDDRAWGEYQMNGRIRRRNLLTAVDGLLARRESRANQGQSAYTIIPLLSCRKTGL